MKPNKAPRLDVNEVKQAIQQVLGKQEQPQPQLQEGKVGNAQTSLPKDEYAQTTLFALYNKIKNVFKRVGLYTVLFPVFKKIHAVAPASLKYKRTVSLESLLLYDGTYFVNNAYQILLGRECDEEAMKYFLGLLQSGQYGKVDIVAKIIKSPEGKEQNLKVKNLGMRYRLCCVLHFIFRIPLIGYILEIPVRFITLPSIVKNLYAEAGYSRMKLADYENQSNSFLEQYDDILNAARGLLRGQIDDVGYNLNNEITQVRDRLLQEIQLLDQVQSNLDSKTKLLSQSISDCKQRLDNIEEVGLEIDESIYIRYEDLFRGTREDIKQRLMFYSDYIKHLSQSQDAFVLDIGCGRGEWLEVLKEQHIKAMGVDMNPFMVQCCRELQLDALRMDGIQYLEKCPAGKYNAITAFQVIEHLSFKRMFHFFQQCYKVLKKDGFVIFETPNTNNLLIAASMFHMDPTHINKLTPVVFQFYLEQAGFKDVEVLMLHKRKEPEYTGNKDVDEVIYKINMEQDIAIVGYKR